MQKIIVMLFVLAAVAGTVNAGFWNAAVGDPNNYWDIAGNWDPVGVPDITTKVQFSRDRAECIIDSAAVSGQLVVGDNGPDDLVHRLTIVDGGSLVCGGTAWAASGYNRNSIVTVEEGASLESVTRFGIGLVGGPLGTPQTSYLNINGGDMVVNGNLQIGTVAGATNSDHTGIVNVYRGTLDVTGNLEFRDPSVGFIDISYGTLTVNGDSTALIADMVDNVPPNITGFGGDGTVQAVFANGVTTITATHPMDPSPINITVPVGDVNLSWTNLDPNNLGDSVWVDVWFGTDPNKLDTLHYLQVVVKGENTITVPVSAPANGTYYWQVDSYIYGDPALVVYDNDDPDASHVIEGDVWSFNATNDAPPTDVYAGVNMITWPNQPVQLGGTYVDDGTSPVNVTWSSDNADAVFSPSDDGGATSNDPNPTVTVDNAAGAVTLTFTVQDELNPAVSDDMIVTVYADPCQAARAGAGRAADYPGDLTGPSGVPDCIINLEDFAAVASEWLRNYALPGPVSIP